MPDALSKGERPASSRLCHVLVVLVLVLAIPSALIRSLVSRVLRITPERATREQNGGTRNHLAPAVIHRGECR